MTDTPEDERDLLRQSVEHRAEGRHARPGRPASGAKATERAPARQRIGIRELRQHASVYVDLAERGYTVDITNRGRLVAQLVPVREPDSPMERLIAAGIIESAEEPGGIGDIEPYPSPSRSGSRPSTGQSATGQSATGQSATGQSASREGS